jgi:hypothetical protein
MRSHGVNESVIAESWVGGVTTSTNTGRPTYSTVAYSIVSKYLVQVRPTKLRTGTVFSNAAFLMMTIKATEI